ncbi:MAG: methyltransferase domain-containing protein [Phycisphaerales bacterium]
MDGRPGGRSGGVEGGAGVHPEGEPAPRRREGADEASGALVGELAGRSRGDDPRHRDGLGGYPGGGGALGRERGHRVRITAVDIHETTLDSAREHVQRELGDDAPIELVQADAKELVERYDPLSFDYVHAGMFLHHLTEIEVLTVLRIMDRVAQRGIVWNDLVRSRVAMAGIWALTLREPPITKHDARVSVRAGFTKKEVKDYASRTSLGYCRYRSSFFTQRFTLAGEKQGAWVIG